MMVLMRKNPLERVRVLKVIRTEADRSTTYQIEGVQ
jgi:hypothetical protein